MNQLDKDIDTSIYMIDKEISYGMENYSPLCLFSNENSNAKNEIFNYENKKVLCPTASGDQFLTAKFYNAKEIITYDINILSKYITNLKVAAIKALSYEEFLIFMVPKLFGKENKFFLSEKTLKQISFYLDGKDLAYWNEIISFASKKGYKEFIAVNNDCYKEEEIKRECLFYSDPNSYNILKNKLLNDSKYEFIVSDIRELRIDGGFDIIDLSNIMTTLVIQSYYDESSYYTLEEARNIYIDFIDDQIIPLVKIKGNILVDYHIAVDEQISKPYFYSEKYTSYKVNSKKENDTDIILKYQRS